MVDFFVKRELQTPTWMRALSTKDIDVTFSVQPRPSVDRCLLLLGGFGALSGLYVASVKRNLATELDQRTSQNQPARSVRSGALYRIDFWQPESNGSALKATSDQPYINDWACVSGCNYLRADRRFDLFGINAGLFDGINAKPQFGKFDPTAELRNISIIRARRYTGR